MPLSLTAARASGLNADEIDIFRPLGEPEAIQDFISSLARNFEPGGDTCRSVRSALKQREAHCIEGAFIAACALMLHGKPALLMDFQADNDDDHVVTLFRHGHHWGAISKSNTVWLRWRDPIYRSLRELAMSYFHEYVRDARKTLRSYSRAFDIGAYEPRQWVTNDADCWEIAAALDESRHYAILTPDQVGRLRRRDKVERAADQIREHKDRQRRSGVTRMSVT